MRFCQPAPKMAGSGAATQSAKIEFGHKIYPRSSDSCKRYDEMTHAAGVAGAFLVVDMGYANEIRQKIDNKEPLNSYVTNNLEIQPSSIYKTPPYHPKIDQNGVVKSNKTSDFLNPYKSPPFNESFYQVL